VKYSFANKTIWITGASSGIGKALALEFAKLNTTLILSARRVEELEKTAAECRELGSKAHVYPFDLSNPAEVELSAKRVVEDFPKIDILVNNGGISQRSLLINTSIEVDRKVMEIDFFSGVILTKALLPGMIKQNGGHIIVISSVTGVFGFPLRSAYSAAKHALHGFYETLWAELHEKGVEVTIACMGRINTNVSLNAITGNGALYGIMDHDTEKGISAQDCAQRIIKAASKKKKTVFIARRELIMVYFKRFSPWLYYKLVSRVQP
jgi:short-subunit dehydrogenase